jgi:hypothetical protein
LVIDLLWVCRGILDMGDTILPWLYYPVSVEDVYGLGIAGISIKQYEEIPTEVPPEASTGISVAEVQQNTVQMENEEYSNENVGKNIDTYG